MIVQNPCRFAGVLSLVMLCRGCPAQRGVAMVWCGKSSKKESRGEKKAEEGNQGEGDKGNACAYPSVSVDDEMGVSCGPGSGFTRAIF